MKTQQTPRQLELFRRNAEISLTLIPRFEALVDRCQDAIDGMSKGDKDKKHVSKRRDYYVTRLIELDEELGENLVELNGPAAEEIKMVHVLDESSINALKSIGS